MFVGVEGDVGAGKSLWMARTALDVLWRNTRWTKRTGKIRQIACNTPLSLAVQAEYRGYIKQKQMELPGIGWRTLEDMIQLTETDIFIDEIANYLDSHDWPLLPGAVKSFFRQHEKRGNDIYFASQSYNQVDISARRLVTELCYVFKIMGSPRPSATRPEVKRVWGFVGMMKENPKEFTETARKFEWSVPRVMWISRELCNTFDTLYEVSNQNLIMRQTRWEKCDDPACVIHRGQGKRIHV